MADWNRIKTEYITTDTSYRRLADKYGIDQATVSRRAKKEDWVSKRQQHISKTQAKVLAADERMRVSRAERLQSVADKLLGKVESLLDERNGDISTQGMRNISGVLKDIKDIQMIRSEADMREQEARIEKLRREASRDEDGGSKTVVVNIGGDSSWQK